MSNLRWICVFVCLCSASLVRLARADEPTVNSVKGHGVWDLDHEFVINQISINAWRDESGVHGTANWMSTYFFAGNEKGWIWYMSVEEIYAYYDTETATVPTVVVICTIEFDNVYPESEGGLVYFTLKDNGDGRSAVPDELMGYPLLGGNFTVR